MTLGLVSTFIITAFDQDQVIENVCFKMTDGIFSHHNLEAYSTLDQRERRHTLDETTDTLPVLLNDAYAHSHVGLLI